jgi:hypothetical protein
MATEKRTKQKRKAARKKPQKILRRAQLAKKNATVKKVAPKKPAKTAKLIASKTRVTVKKKPSGIKKRPRRVPLPDRAIEIVTVGPLGPGLESGGQAGALQGLSGEELATSESVTELLEEGNAFEAEVVKGVEDAPDADKGPIKTHEVPEDDVPKEYLDKDR